MQAAIEIQGLAKTYGAGDEKVISVAGIDLSVGAGEVFGLLGPNGAGKTTTIKMLAGLVFPTAGTIRLLGSSISDVRLKARIGYLPETIGLSTFMRAAEYLDFHARLHGMGAGRRRQKVAEVLEQTGLAKNADSRVRNFSRGMIQRIGLAQAIINEPELLLLDEPAATLDPIGRRQLREIIVRLRDRGTTVFINSHLLSEVEMTCGSIGIMSRGRLIRVDRLKAVVKPVRLVEVRAEGLSAEATASIARLATKVDDHGDGRFTATLESEEDLSRLAELITASGEALKEFTPRNVTLEAAFLEEIEEAEQR